MLSPNEFRYGLFCLGLTFVHKNVRGAVLGTDIKGDLFLYHNGRILPVDGQKCCTDWFVYDDWVPVPKECL